jgi:hypothetical protein
MSMMCICGMAVSVAMRAVAIDTLMIGVWTGLVRTVSKYATVFVITCCTLFSYVCHVSLRIGKTKRCRAKFKIRDSSVVQIHVVVLAA